MSQSRSRSVGEAVVNISIGFTLNFCLNMVIFNGFGYNLSMHDSFIIGMIFTGVSLVRQYIIRRWFSKGD